MRHSRQFDRIAIVTLLALLCFLPRALGADSDSPSIAGTTKENPYVWKPKTRSVSVFKNGYGFFTRQATVALHEGWGHAADVPPATFGTLAIYSQDPKQLVDIVGVGDGELIRFEVPGDDPVSPESRRTALTSALGTSVKLVVRANEQMRDVEGVVEAINIAKGRRWWRPFSKTVEQAAESSAPGIGLGLSISHRLARQMGGRLIVESSSSGTTVTLVLPKGSVQVRE